MDEEKNCPVLDTSGLTPQEALDKMMSTSVRCDDGCDYSNNNSSCDSGDRECAKENYRKGNDFYFTTNKYPSSLLNSGNTLSQKEAETRALGFGSMVMGGLNEAIQNAHHIKNNLNIKGITKNISFGLSFIEKAKGIGNSNNIKKDVFAMCTAQVVSKILPYACGTGKAICKGGANIAGDQIGKRAGEFLYDNLAPEVIELAYPVMETVVEVEAFFSKKVDEGIDVLSEEGKKAYRKFKDHYKKTKAYWRSLDIGFPVLLDLDGDGVELVPLSGSRVAFDMTGDGKKNATGWVGADDGMLVRDFNNNGTIDDYKEISFARFGNNPKSDLVGLRHFDTNRNWLLDKADKDFNQFKVWRDLNQNGISEKKELFTLKELGIESIALRSIPLQTRLESFFDNIPVGFSFYKKGKDDYGAVLDVGFVYSKEDKPLKLKGEKQSSVQIGTSKPETLKGTKGNNMMVGLAGADIMNGLAGDDYLFGGAGNDNINGGAGNDFLFAGEGNNKLRGGSGKDHFVIDMRSSIPKGIDLIRDFNIAQGDKLVSLAYQEERAVEQLDYALTHQTFRKNVRTLTFKNGRVVRLVGVKQRLNWSHVDIGTDKLITSRSFLPREIVSSQILKKNKQNIRILKKMFRTMIEFSECEKLTFFFDRNTKITYSVKGFHGQYAEKKELKKNNKAKHEFYAFPIDDLDRDGIGDIAFYSPEKKRYGYVMSRYGQTASCWGYRKYAPTAKGMSYDTMLGLFRNKYKHTKLNRKLAVMKRRKYKKHYNAYFLNGRPLKKTKISVQSLDPKMSVQLNGDILTVTPNQKHAWKKRVRLTKHERVNGNVPANYNSFKLNIRHTDLMEHFKLVGFTRPGQRKIALLKRSKRSRGFPSFIDKSVNALQGLTVNDFIRTLTVVNGQDPQIMTMCSLAFRDHWKNGKATPETIELAKKFSSTFKENVPYNKKSKEFEPNFELTNTLKNGENVISIFDAAQSKKLRFEIKQKSHISQYAFVLQKAE